MTPEDLRAPFSFLLGDVKSKAVISWDEITWFLVGLAGVVYCLHGLRRLMSKSMVVGFAVLKFWAAATLVERVWSDTRQGNTPALFGIRVAVVDLTMGVLFLGAAAKPSPPNTRKTN